MDGEPPPSEHAGSELVRPRRIDGNDAPARIERYEPETHFQWRDRSGFRSRPFGKHENGIVAVEFFYYEAKGLAIDFIPYRHPKKLSHILRNIRLSIGKLEQGIRKNYRIKVEGSLFEFLDLLKRIPPEKSKTRPRLSDLAYQFIGMLDAKLAIPPKFCFQVCLGYRGKFSLYELWVEKNAIIEKIVIVSAKMKVVSGDILSQINPAINPPGSAIR